MQFYGGGFFDAWLQLMLFYYGAGILLHFVIPRVFPVRGVQEHARATNDVWRDCMYSLGPIAVKAGVWSGCEWLQSRGWGLFYISHEPASIPHVLYMAACVVILDYVHDAWFYWTHRLLHWRPLYRHVHYIHHKKKLDDGLIPVEAGIWSRVPSAFTGYSFHVVEALIVFANEILLGFVIPIDMRLHRVYHLFTTLIHLGGHAGYEMSPFIPHMSNLFMCLFHGLSHGYKGFNTVKHHDMHHQYPLKHFSLYFTHWDRVCGTLHPRYDTSVVQYFSAAKEQIS